MFAVRILALGLTAPSGWAETGDPAKGKPTYKRLCSVCHGDHGKGDGPAGQMLKPQAADLTSSKVKGAAVEHSIICPLTIGALLIREKEINSTELGCFKTGAVQKRP